MRYLVPKTAERCITGSLPFGCGVGEGVRSNGVDGSEGGGRDKLSVDAIVDCERFGPEKFWSCTVDHFESAAKFGRSFGN